MRTKPLPILPGNCRILNNCHDWDNESIKAVNGGDILGIAGGHVAAVAWIVTLIHDYRDHAERIRDEVLAKALRQLEGGKPADEVVGFLAHTLTNKLLHGPSARLREAGRDGQEELLEAANEIFQLKGKSESSS